MIKDKKREEEHFYCEMENCKKDLGTIRAAGFYIYKHLRICVSCFEKLKKENNQIEEGGDL